jgi:hypothetical protein
VEHKALMDKVGDRVRFQLYSGRDVDGIIRAIVKTTAGVKLRMEYGAGNYVATTNPDQIVRQAEPKEDAEF